jgi:hypothetical protein
MLETADPYVQLLRDDFRNFVFVVWKHLGLPSPTEIQYDIAHYLQHGPRRRGIEAFRGEGKSWLTAAYVLWRLWLEANERVLVASASKERADNFSIFCKRLINEMPLLVQLKAKEGQRDSNISFDVGNSAPHQAPSVKSVGITGQLAGSRATIIVADDVEVPKNSVTHTMREKLSEAVKEFDAILMSAQDLKTMGMEQSEVIYLGTPQTEMSLYNLLPARGYEVRIWPSRFPNAKLRERYAGKLAPYISEKLDADPSLATACSGRGAPTDPARFDDQDLLEREASYGRSGFAMQFQLDTSVSDSERYPLKLSDLMVMDVSMTLAPVSLAWGSGREQIIDHLDPPGLAGDRFHRPMFIHQQFVPYTGIAMVIDPSGRGGDETGYAVVAMLNGTLFVLKAGGLKGGYDDATLQELADIAKLCAVKHIIVESNFGDGMFTKLLTPFLTRTYPCTIEELHSVGQKELRILDVMEPVLNQHRIVISEELVKSDAEAEVKYQLLFQMTRLTRERGSLAKDDRIDVLSMAVKYWVEQMDRDVRKAAEDHKAAMVDQELANFHQHVLGMPQQSNNWMN